MKKLLALLLILVLPLCACSNSEEPAPNTEETETAIQPEQPKGSLQNPYLVGETIVIEELYPANTHSEKDTPFRMELTVTQSYTPDQAIALWNSD